MRAHSPGESIIEVTPLPIGSRLLIEQFEVVLVELLEEVIP